MFISNGWHFAVVSGKCLGTLTNIYSNHEAQNSSRCSSAAGEKWARKGYVSSQLYGRGHSPVSRILLVPLCQLLALGRPASLFGDWLSLWEKRALAFDSPNLFNVSGS